MEAIFLSNGIHVADSTEKHYRRGWVNTPCPFCVGSSGNHLGWSINQQYFICWRCGWHPLDKVLSTLVRNTDSISDILSDYKTSSIRIKKEDRVATATKCVLPSNIPLSKAARKYLRARKFNPTRLSALWELRSTNNLVCLPSMKNRIVAPIYYKGRLVTYQTRDVTNKAKLRYITAAKDKEVVHHKHLVYGIDQVPTDSVVIVEGITDVWRLGFGAVCTFGIKYTPYQLLVLSKFKNRFVLYDTTDPQARKQGRKLAEELSSFNGNTEYIELTGKYSRCDPAELPSTYASDLMNELK